MRLHIPTVAALILFAVGCGGSGPSESLVLSDVPASTSALTGRWQSPQAHGGLLIEFDHEGRVATGIDELVPEGVRFDTNELGLLEGRNEDGDRWYAQIPSESDQYLLLMFAGGGLGLFQRAPAPRDATPVNDDMIRASGWTGTSISLRDGNVPTGVIGLRLSIEPSNVFSVAFSDGTAIKTVANTGPIAVRIPEDERVFTAGYLAGPDQRTLILLLSDDEKCFVVLEDSENADDTVRLWLIVREPPRGP